MNSRSDSQGAPRPPQAAPPPPRAHAWLPWRRWPPLLALATALFAFTLPAVLATAQFLMSESLFLALFFVALLAFERSLARPGARPTLVAGLAAGLLPATRTIGAACLLG